MRLPIIVAIVACAAGCGGSKEPRMPSSWANFECKDRALSYMVVGSLAADEAGIQIDCNQTGPRVVRWLVDNDGTRVEDSAAMTPGEFEDVWKRVEGVGWRNLRDCPPEGGNVPTYQFDVADWDGSASFECEAMRPAFPWITLIDELDQLAARIRGDRSKNQVDVDDSDLVGP
jgi:hypothetical protein